MNRAEKGMVALLIILGILIWPSSINTTYASSGTTFTNHEVITTYTE